MENYKEDYLGILDGVRGLMAFWVFFGHLELYLLGKESTPWGAPGIAVDVFMLLSGFLMAYHWNIREKKFNNLSSQTVDFYIRRFFRIAPLYYLLLAVSLAFQKYFFICRDYLTSTVPPPWQQQILHNPTNSTLNLQNVIMHVTFLFGLIPQYAANNSLPDWSIGLEMQFYLIFPLIIICLTRWGAFSTVITSLVLALAANKFIGLYITSAKAFTYPQPSLILFKINIFIAGMCLAFAYCSKPKPQFFSWLILGIMALMKTAIQVKFFAFFIMFMLYFDGGGQRKTEAFHFLVSNRIAKFLGDTSYSVYLLHKLILLPVLYILTQQAWFLNSHPHKRLMVAFITAGVPVYALGYVLFRTIELPGIEWGRKILSRLNPGK